MKSIDWIPPEPLTITQVLKYREFDHISHIAPMLGREPNPKQNVVVMYVGIAGRGLLAVFDAEAGNWRGLETETGLEGLSGATDAMDEIMDFLSETDPATGYALLQGVDAHRN